MFCKSGFSKDCAGGEPDSFSSAGMMIEDTEDCVCVEKSESVQERERERDTAEQEQTLLIEERFIQTEFQKWIVA